MDAQRTTQLANRSRRLFPVPPPALACDTPAQQPGEGVGYFHLFSFGHYHFPTVLDAEQPAASSSEARECQHWVAGSALLWGTASMGL